MEEILARMVEKMASMEDRLAHVDVLEGRCAALGRESVAMREEGWTR